MKKILFSIIRWITIHFPLPDSLRNITMWPITSRLLPKDFNAIISRSDYQIIADLKDQLNRMLLFFGASVRYLWEPQTTKLAQLIIRDKKHSVIAGAHIGYIDLELMNSLSPGAQIYTFEPAQYLYKRTTENIALNNADDKIHLYHAALGDSEGECTIYVEDLRTSIAPYSQAHRINNNIEKVAQHTLDEFKKDTKIERVDFLFLDIEGLEYAVFSGAQVILTEDRPVIIFEVSPKIMGTLAHTKEDLFKQLQNKDYELYAIEDNYHLSEVKKWDTRPIQIVPIEKYVIIDSYINVVAVPKADQVTMNLLKPFIYER